MKADHLIELYDNNNEIIVDGETKAISTPLKHKKRDTSTCTK